ncbi:MAG: F0F1 ATP synthase subunit epsilon [Actinomycetota bacterium]
MALQVQLVSAEDDLFVGEAEFVSARTVEGDIGILPGHTPILAQLAASQVKIVSAGAEHKFRIDSGFLTVKDDKVIILAEPETGEPE